MRKLTEWHSYHGAAARTTDQHGANETEHPPSQTVRRTAPVTMQVASASTSAGKSAESDNAPPDDEFSHDLDLLLRSVGRSPTATAAAGHHPRNASTVAFAEEFDADLRDLTARLANA